MIDAKAVKTKLLELRASIDLADVANQKPGTMNVWQRSLVDYIDHALDHAQCLIELSPDELNSADVWERHTRYWPSGEVVVVTPEAEVALNNYFHGKTKELVLP